MKSGLFGLCGKLNKIGRYGTWMNERIVPVAMIFTRHWLPFVAGGSKNLQPFCAPHLSSLFLLL